jgi:lipopolysaccharide export system protein LptA
MEAINKKRALAIGIKARFPLVARIVGLTILVVAIVFVGISYYKLRNNQRFMLWPKAPALSKEVTGIIEGYERRVTKGDRLYLWLKASRDITFADKHHELENVTLSVYPPVGDKPDQISSDRAIYEQEKSLITFVGHVKIETKDALKLETESLSYDQNTEVAHTDSFFKFARENVSGQATGAVVEAKTKKVRMNKDVQVVVVPTSNNSSSGRPVTIRSANALFEQDSLKLSFAGGVATLNQQQRLEKVELRGNSYLRSMEEGRAAELRAADIDFFLDSEQRLERAVGMRDLQVSTLDSDSEMKLSGATLLEAKFQVQADRSLLREMRTEGRSVIDLAAPKSKANDPRSANKRLTADTVKLFWRTSGKDLEKAEAVGNAELLVDPIVKNEKADRKTITAPRFDCEFFEAGNLARTFTATGGTKAVLEPAQSADGKRVRTLTSQKMAASFVRDTQDVERMDAQGDAKFNQDDRNGVASNISYSADDQTVRLRGGEPTVWDSRARTKAIELDSDLKNKVSYARGKVATTYYSQEQTNGATPFSKVKSPVYVVSDRGEFHHDPGVAVYTTNARAWQDDNFVRGDKLTIYTNEKRTNAEGRVQTTLYNSHGRDDAGSTVPVFASADAMSYSDPNRLIHYEGNVDIRQGTDRITSGLADVYLKSDSSEMEKTVAERNVVLTQPNRKGTGDWVQYTSADEVAVLKGNPARVEDTEQGTTEGGRLTVYIREGRVVGDDSRGPQSAGRVRSTHKVRKP